VDVLAVGEDAAGRKLPSKAWMALRRLGWSIAPPAGVKVNDRIVRMAQEQAGRALRAAKWRADLAAGVLAAWPVDPAKRTPQEWDAVREADWTWVSCPITLPPTIPPGAVPHLPTPTTISASSPQTPRTT
jgi:hypothetical protein